jgi:hypothetical protein
MNVAERAVCAAREFSWFQRQIPLFTGTFEHFMLESLANTCVFLFNGLFFQGYRKTLTSAGVSGRFGWKSAVDWRVCDRGTVSGNGSGICRKGSVFIRVTGFTKAHRLLFR